MGKVIETYKIQVLSPKEYNKKVPHKMIGTLDTRESNGFANAETKIAFIKDSGDEEFNQHVI